MKDTIIPAVLPRNFDEIVDLANEVRSLVPIMQVDLCDGTFVSSKTWPFLDDALVNIRDDFEMPGWEFLDYEFDLMVSHPHQYIEQVVNMAASRVILHLDSEDDSLLIDTAVAYSKYDIEIGFAFQNKHDHSRLKRIVERYTKETGNTPYIQVMGIEKIGMQRQPFSEATLHTLEVLAKEFPNYILQVDGSVNADTISKLYASGARRFVIGSAMKMMDNVPDALKHFKSLAI